MNAVCALGFIGGMVWALLENRANRFAEGFFEECLDLEKQLTGSSGIFGSFGGMTQHRPKGLVKTYVVLVVVPIVFAALYVALLVISVFAAAGRF